MDANCFGATCTQLKTQAFSEANACAVAKAVDEPVDGCKFSQFPELALAIRSSIFNLGSLLGLTSLPGMDSNDDGM